MTPDRRAVGYGYSVRTGVVLYPLCFMADTNKESRVLVLRFDEAGALQSFKVYKDIQQVPEYEGFMLWQRQMQAKLLRERNQQQQEQQQAPMTRAFARTSTRRACDPMTRWQTLKPVLLPSFLAAARRVVAGVACTSVHPEWHRHRRDVRRRSATKIGKPLRDRQATQHDVFNLLGLPHVIEVLRLGRRYRWTSATPLVVWPLCFQAIPAQRPPLPRAPLARTAARDVPVSKDDGVLVDFTFPAAPAAPGRLRQH